MTANLITNGSGPVSSPSHNPNLPLNHTKEGFAHVSFPGTTGGYSVNIEGRCAPDAPWSTLVNVACANGTSQIVWIAIVPEMRATISSGATGVSVWLAY